MVFFLVTANAVSSSPIFFTLMTEAILSSVTSVLTRTTLRNIPEDAILQACTEFLPPRPVTGIALLLLLLYNLMHSFAATILLLFIVAAASCVWGDRTCRGRGRPPKIGDIPRWVQSLTYSVGYINAFWVLVYAFGDLVDVKYLASRS
jgi:hypothetical protein